MKFRMKCSCANRIFQDREKKYIEAQRISERVNYDIGNDKRVGLLQWY
jgi:excinuclease UvrABC helicase subunit UvrB